jgi:F-type H+-transporting ATPase subunit b
MLRDMADGDMEEQIIAVFMKRMKTLPGEERDEIIEALGKNSRATFVSSFELDSGQRSQITRSLNDILDAQMDVEYKESEKLICGIEFQTEDRVISWSLDQYLDQLEKNTLEMLSREKTETG